MELEVTWNRAIRVWWSYLWRAIITAIVAIVFSAAVGFILGMVAGILGLPIPVIQGIGAVVGFVIGLAFSVVPFKLILGKDYGEFRLVLQSTERSQQEAKETADVVRDDDPNYYAPPRFSADV